MFEGVTQDNNGNKRKEWDGKEEERACVLRGGEADGSREEAIVTRQRGTRDVYRRV